MAKGQPQDPDILKLKKRAVEEIVELMLQDDVFVVDGTPMATVTMPDKTYRKKPLMPGQEMFFTSAHVSDKTGQPLFVFTPVDAQLYATAEFNPKEMDQVFPLFGAQLAEKLQTNHTESVGQLIHSLVEAIHRRDAETKVEEVKIAEVTYENNPLFGRF